MIFLFLKLLGIDLTLERDKNIRVISDWKFGKFHEARRERVLPWILSVRVKHANEMLQQHLKINSTMLTRRSWKLSTTTYLPVPIQLSSSFLRHSSSAPCPLSLIEKTSTGSRSYPHFSTIIHDKNHQRESVYVSWTDDTSTKANVPAVSFRRCVQTIIQRGRKFPAKV